AGMWCSALAFGTDIKEFAIEGAPGMKKYLITWSVKDWCTSSSANRGELEFVQEVIARIDPECAPTEEGSLGSSFVAGKIQTALNSPLEDIEVKAILDRGAPLILSTNSEGSFEFEMENGTSIHLIPENNSGHAEGITTADLIDIQRHILQKSALTNPFQKLAADVNGNGLIDGLDVMELRRIVLNPSRKFPNNTSWRFYESTSGAEIFEISNLERDYEVDFVGVKIGDVNMSSDPASRSRSTSGRLHLNVADRKMKGGEIYRVDVRSDNFEDILGLQFTMQYSSAYIDVVAFESGVLKLTEDNYYHFEPRSMSGLTSQMGLITASWSEGNEVSLHTDDVLFTIVVKARSQADLRDVIGINDRVVKAEAYEGSGNLRSVGMNFGASSTREEFALYQNHPNPYTGETTIGFRLPNATHATMTIYTVTGKLIKRIEGEFEAGYNELRISSMELGSSGVLYYQLDTDKYTATKKMIVLE
ncbi:MAG TPA: T9SS type A sorting domain-containing protein, partial [Membranihabitans sp.]|nr:T9SS type A sorting domain-containing protein [Membranihabitans sp.]